MAVLNIPIDPNQPNHEFSIELDGVVYLMNFRKNFRSLRWVLTLKKEDGTVLVSGVPLVTGISILKQYPADDMPPGDLYVDDTTANNTEPGEEGFGNTHQLVYVEAGTTV